MKFVFFFFWFLTKFCLLIHFTEIHSILAETGEYNSYIEIYPGRFKKYPGYIIYYIMPNPLHHTHTEYLVACQNIGKTLLILRFTSGRLDSHYVHTLHCVGQKLFLFGHNSTRNGGFIIVCIINICFRRLSYLSSVGIFAFCIRARNPYLISKMR